jgi:hypothetical protein
MTDNVQSDGSILAPADQDAMAKASLRSQRVFRARELVQA